jgi:putative exporter of polyketide antibiotics
MTHQGWDVQLTPYAARDWRATFFPVGIAHSIVGISAWERTPGWAVAHALPPKRSNWTSVRVWVD